MPNNCSQKSIEKQYSSCMITCRGADLSQDPVILTPLSLLGGPVIGLLPTYSQVLFNLREFDISFAGFGGEKR